VKVLFLTPHLPYPPRSGGLVKSWAMVEFLRRHVELWLVCFRQGPWDAAQREWAQGWGERLLALPLRRPRGPISYLASVARGLPLSVYRNHSPAMAHLVRQVLEAGFQAVVADHLYMGHYVPPEFPGRKVLHLHNVESLLWERHVPLAGPLAPLVWWETRRLRQYERALFPRFHRLLVVSKDEGEALRALGVPEGKVAVLPNVARPDLLARPSLEPPSGGKVAFLGTLSWPPNQDGLRWFLRECLPRLRAVRPQARLVVAGQGAPSWLRRAARRRALELLSPLDDAGEEAVYRRARALVEPARGGGGTRVKVLNALARGLPVVATPRGVAGLALEPGVHILVAGGAQEMAEALAQLLDDDGLWRRLSLAGREAVGRLYTPEAALPPLLEALT